MVTQDVLNPNIAHDLEILQPYLKDRDAGASEPQVYTDEKEREATLNYLKNRSLVIKNLLLRCLRERRRMCIKVFQVHNAHSKGRPPN